MPRLVYKLYSQTTINNGYAYIGLAKRDYVATYHYVLGYVAMWLAKNAMENLKTILGW